MNGHNVVELHGFFRYARYNGHHTLHATFPTVHATIPVAPFRPATAILRHSSRYSAQPPYYIHATDQLPQRSTRHNRKPPTCFSVDKPSCIRYTIPIIYLYFFTRQPTITWSYHATHAGKLLSCNSPTGKYHQQRNNRCRI